MLEESTPVQTCAIYPHLHSIIVQDVDFLSILCCSRRVDQLAINIALSRRSIRICGDEDLRSLPRQNVREPTPGANSRWAVVVDKLDEILHLFALKVWIRGLLEPCLDVVIH